MCALNVLKGSREPTEPEPRGERAGRAHREPTEPEPRGESRESPQSPEPRGESEPRGRARRAHGA